MRCKRGDVVIVLFPDSNRMTGHRRPALVISADNLNTGVPQTTVAMITSNQARAGHPSRVVVNQNSTEGLQMGIMTDSVIMTDNVVTVRDNLLQRRIGHLNDMTTVDTALRHSLGL